VVRHLLGSVRPWVLSPVFKKKKRKGGRKERKKKGRKKDFFKSNLPHNFCPTYSSFTLEFISQRTFNSAIGIKCLQV
jgi:hypothetical protein